MLFERDKMTFKLGKYKGENVFEVADEDPKYLVWVLENLDGLTSEEREILDEALVSFRYTA